MRIARLDLIRFGKFTNKSISLPRAGRDFHLIIGPNEAGKSTLRDSIQDLLFGIETRSRYNFIHPHAEMRLGALIEEDAGSLDFVRTKARNRTLQTVAGDPLADDALMPYLGQTDRSLFVQMFGLNHERLVKGGQEILSASNDVGQILFQAAAGIGRLGEIRDRLEAEADSLWAKRRAGDREYYIASAELERAEALLKQLTVRTRDWQEARAKVDALADELHQTHRQYQSLEQERVCLERIRRVAPLVASLSDMDAQKAALGNVVNLPESAESQLADAERDMSMAQATLQLLKAQADGLRSQIVNIHPDESVLARARDVEGLAATRMQVQNVESDIGKREKEVGDLLESVATSARQLGWRAEDETTVLAQLPNSLVRSSIDSLVRRHDALQQSLISAQDALFTREGEIKIVDAEIAGLKIIELPALLTVALNRARNLGDVDTQGKRLQLAIERARRDLDSASHELGAWNPGIDKLRGLVVPAIEETDALNKQRSELTNTITGLDERLAEGDSDLAAISLEISQFKDAHHPVTLDDVRQARQTRDVRWSAIKAGAIPVAQATSIYEQEVNQADSLSDQRHDKAQEEAELQSRLDRLQRRELQVAGLRSRRIACAEELARLDKDWCDHSHSIGLEGMPFLRFNAWRTTRGHVLSLAQVLEDATAAYDEFVANADDAESRLEQSMVDVAPDIEEYSLQQLILFAEKIIQNTARAEERYKTLAAQRLRAEAELPNLLRQLAGATKAFDDWSLDLKKHLVAAHLPEDANLGAVENALAHFADMEKKLEKIRDIRINRIGLMQTDLKSFVMLARTLAKAIAPGLISESASQIAITLERQLKESTSAAKELSRLNAELERLSDQIQATKTRITEAEASLTPMMKLSGTESHEALRGAIERSDRIRALTIDTSQALRQLLQAGDGLDREALETELSLADVTLATTRLVEIRLQLDEAVTTQNRISAELSTAETELAKISGHDQAARAEAGRQESMARMANVAERFIKVRTAASLLRWSIERFRESKQGPMLARASNIFRGLTCGAFGRLIVDYDGEPLQLFGQRSTNELVGIEGMSEGTRDQLYFSLRLAALELHLEQSNALPFVADDLFINYDDTRAKAGFEALAQLSERAQVIFLSHHDHLISYAQSVFGMDLNVVEL